MSAALAYLLAGISPRPVIRATRVQSLPGNSTGSATKEAWTHLLPGNSTGLGVRKTGHSPKRLQRRCTAQLPNCPSAPVSCAKVIDATQAFALMATGKTLQKLDPTPWRARTSVANDAHPFASLSRRRFSRHDARLEQNTRRGGKVELPIG